MVLDAVVFDGAGWLKLPPTGAWPRAFRVLGSVWILAYSEGRSNFLSEIMTRWILTRGCESVDIDGTLSSNVGGSPRASWAIWKAVETSVALSIWAKKVGFRLLTELARRCRTSKAKASGSESSVRPVITLKSWMMSLEPGWT